MLIANPLYDVVFKSLMEDIEIAKGLVATLTGLDVKELHPRPRETSVSIEAGMSVTVYRLDYVATIKKSDGSYDKVLIEVQKAKLGSEIRRFRQYLGQQYIHPETIIDEDGFEIKKHPHIVAIYILGFNLGDKIPAFAKVDRKYMNAVTGQHFDANCEFIEALTHDMYILQTRKVPHKAKNNLERLLSIFSQKDFVEGNEHTISYPDPLTKAKSKLVQRILRHLSKLSASRKIKERMDAEDLAYSEFEAAVQTKTLELKKDIEAAVREKEKVQEEFEKVQKESEKAQRESEKAQRESEKAQKESEKAQKESEKAQKESEKAQKESEKVKKDALTKVEHAFQALIASGIPEKEAKKILSM